MLRRSARSTTSTTRSPSSTASTSATSRQGDFGETTNGIKVIDQLKARYPITAKLALMALAFEAIVGITVGVFTGIKKRRVPRQPRPHLDAGRHLDPRLRHRWCLPVLPRRQARSLPGHRHLGEPVVLPADAPRDGPRLDLARLHLPPDAHEPRREPALGLRPHRDAKGLTAPPRRSGCTPCATRSSPWSRSSASTSGSCSAAPSSPRPSSTSPAWADTSSGRSAHRDGASVVGTVTVLVIVFLFVNLLVDLLYGLLDPRISHD